MSLLDRQIERSNNCDYFRLYHLQQSVLSELFSQDGSGSKGTNFIKKNDTVYKFAKYWVLSVNLLHQRLI